MEFYVALVLALGLACAAGVQYFYLLFLESRGRQYRARIAELERINHSLAAGLREAEERLRREEERESDLWPESIGGDSAHPLN